MTERGQERRAGQRFGTEVDVEWESPAGRFEGVLSDISANGCFILSSGTVSDGQKVRIFMHVDGDVNVEFQGEVANNTPEIGFAVRFLDVSDAHREVIGRLVASE